MSSSLMRGKNPRTPLQPYHTTLVDRNFKVFFFTFYFEFPSANLVTTTTIFVQIRNLNKSLTILNSTANHLYKENSSLSLTLEPLYCSSFATAVGVI